MGCRGIHVPPYTACLAHLSPRKRRRYLASLGPGADLDHRGTPFTAGLLDELRAALTDPATDRLCFGTADFSGAAFGGPARFSGATFRGEAWFIGAEFGGRALGPLVCTGTLNLSEMVFERAVTIEAAAATVRCRRTRWASTAALRLRHAEVDLSDAVLERPVSISAYPRPFIGPGGEEMAEPGLANLRLRITSLQGVDAAHLVLTGVDLTECRFAGAVHLDQLRLEGRITFARPPKGWWRSRRRTLAEEHHWRAAAAGRPAPSTQLSPREWRPGPDHPDLESAPGPETVAALYRQLRKALEDTRNEPGAADFYYGECEMRRHDRGRNGHPGTPRGERALLRVYWAVSGYGLRVSRALACLLVVMLFALVVMVWWGLPVEATELTTTGRQVAAGQEITLTTGTPAPVNPSGPLAERMTTDRFEESLRVVVNSAVFRSSGQDLTTTGAYTQMAVRFIAPVLLALAILAVRGRVKR